VGDVTYGSGAINRHYRAHYGMHRLALHACSIEFDHPTTGERIVASAPLPEDLSRALEALDLLTHAGADA
jgi:23S rRNA pseudouridine955/2504/2580 synthase